MNENAYSIVDGVRTYKLYLNGLWLESSDNVFSSCINPANNCKFASNYVASKSDALEAINAAKIASKSWRKTLASEREVLLLKLLDIIDSRYDEIKSLIICESGSTISKAEQEILYVQDLLRSAAGEVRHVFGETFPVTKKGQLSLSLRVPIGVVVGISPFNAPFILAMKKIVFALACGNTFILKPSEETPIIGILIADLFDQAGFPKGVLNVIPTTQDRIGNLLLEDPRVNFVTFTGSTKVGKLIAEISAKNFKKYSLELGGKSPLIILNDYDINQAVDAAISGVFYHQGQQCMAGSRILIEDKIFEDFCDRFVKKTASLVVGDPSDKRTYIGPLIKASQCHFIKAQIDDATNKGASILIGGDFEDNYFQPTVLVDVDNSMRIYYEESFGPVVSLIKVSNVSEALEKANDSDYGLSAGILTNDLQKAMYLASNLECGMVHVNGNSFSDEPHVPFGGIKNSGFGREGGKYSIDELTELKWITVQQEQRTYSF